MLDNPRYTGYAIFGRWTKHETLLDPEDVAAGHVVGSSALRQTGLKWLLSCGLHCGGDRQLSPGTSG
ncbi:hypothetical protein [Amycolatopsis sp. NPDC051372]|uniref:hypothetical protein n=1 Tax=Amycolatopsis sp. NPDC051372 TaxID=3155669 RepID=UPI0034478459